MNIHNRWFQLGASLIAMIMIANLQYAWTLFVGPLQKSTGWKLSDIQFAFTLFIIFQTWVQPFDGWLIDRLGPRGFVTAAGVMCGLGWAGMGYANSLPMLYALYCLAGAGAAFVYSGSVGSALKWFKERRGLAAGIMTAGFGGGTALFIPFIQSSIIGNGYRATFVSTGILQGVVIAVVAQFLRHPPATTAPGKTENKAAATGEKKQFTTMEVLRTTQFYVMYVAFVLMATGGLLVTANAGPMARSWGFSITLAATLSPLANGASRVFWGWISDKFAAQVEYPLGFYVLLTVLGFPLAAATYTTSPVGASLLFFWAMFVTAGFIVIGLRSGARAYPASQSSMVAGIAAGSWSALVAAILPLLGRWFDQKLYEQTFTLVALMPVVGTFAWWLLARNFNMTERTPAQA